jgi:3-hydroxyisobutyryl-CoA hydrolase
MSTAPELPKELPGDEPDDVLFSSLYGVRLIELNRPKKLNSLNGSMARKILPRLKVGDSDPAVCDNVLVAKPVE